MSVCAAGEEKSLVWVTIGKPQHQAWLLSTKAQDDDADGGISSCYIEYTSNQARAWVSANQVCDELPPRRRKSSLITQESWQTTPKKARLVSPPQASSTVASLPSKASLLEDGAPNEEEPPQAQRRLAIDDKEEEPLDDSKPATVFVEDGTSTVATVSSVSQSAASSSDVPISADDTAEEQEEEEATIKGPPIVCGLKIREKFNDGKYYKGEIVCDNPREVIDTETNMEVLTWTVLYEDGMKGDRSKEEIYKWLHTEGEEEAETETRSSKKSKRSSVDAYQRAYEELCFKAGVTEELVVAALDKLKPTSNNRYYSIQEAMKLICEAQREAARTDPHKYSEEVHETEDGKFHPQIGMKVRKMVQGYTYNGKVTDGPQKFDGVELWEVEFVEGDKEDWTFDELRQYRASRPIRTHPVRGRQLCALELFCGCGVMTQAFCEKKWQVRSLDNNPKSAATDIVSIMNLKWENIGVVPDYMHASPPCHTFSNLSHGYHRNVYKGEYEKTDEAHENNRYLLNLAYLMHFTLERKPYAIFTIENPVGQLRLMPLMKYLENKFKLRSAVVHYCALGREDKKPTEIWSNDHGLIERLDTFKCGPHTCPYHDKEHPVGVKMHGRRYNAAAIPEALAEEIADYVHSTFYQRRIRQSTSPEKPLTPKEEAEFNRIMSGPDEMKTEKALQVT